MRALHFPCSNFCLVATFIDSLGVCNAWTEDTFDNTTALAWVLKVREKLEQMQTVAWKMQETTQSTMKKIYIYI